MKVISGDSHVLEPHDLWTTRMAGGPFVGESTTRMSMDAMTPFTTGQLLGSPGLWIGLAIAAAFLAVAVRLRRHRGPI